jgi:hypothetical protein
MNMSFVSTQRSGQTVGAAGALTLFHLLLPPEGSMAKGQIDHGAYRMLAKPTSRSKMSLEYTEETLH